MTTLAPPPPARASTLAALLPPTGTPIRREGYVMYHDPISSHWLRVYLVLTDTELSLHSTSSRYSRPVRNAVAVNNVTHLYCSLERPGAPEAHIPVLGVLVNDDDLIVLRTPERRLLSDWCSYFAEVLRTPFVSSTTPEPSAEATEGTEDNNGKELWKPVEAMAAHRSLMHLQLYAALYRGHAAFAATPTAPTTPTTASSTTTATTTTTTSGAAKTSTTGNKNKSTNKSVLMRRGSLSADVPRRGPIRRATDGAAATRRHADPLAPVTASRLNQTTIGVNLKAHTKPSAVPSRLNVNKSALAACDDVAVLMQVQTKRCRSADKVGGFSSASASVSREGSTKSSSNKINKSSAKNTSEHNPATNTTTTAATTTTKSSIPRFSQRRSPSLEKKDSLPVPTSSASSLRASAEQHDSPRPSQQQEANSVCKGENTKDDKTDNNQSDSKDDNSGTNNSAAPSMPPLAPVPATTTAASIAQLNKLKELREQVETLSARNIDLEIDNANMGARVLELENEVDHMKAGMAEWKRRYASLESQMTCQEEANKARWESEKETLLRNVQEEVAEQMQAVRAKFLEKEAALEARIKELEEKENSSPDSS